LQGEQRQPAVGDLVDRVGVLPGLDRAATMAPGAVSRPRFGHTAHLVPARYAPRKTAWARRGNRRTGAILRQPALLPRLSGRNRVITRLPFDPVRRDSEVSAARVPAWGIQPPPRRSDGNRVVGARRRGVPLPRVDARFRSLCAAPLAFD